MKAMTKILAVLALVAMAGMAFAKDPAQSGDKPAKPEAIRGVVQAVTANSITVKSKGGKETTVSTNEQTKFKVDKKEGTITDVKVGMRVNITPADGSVATKVSAMTPNPDADKGHEGHGHGEKAH